VPGTFHKATVPFFQGEAMPRRQNQFVQGGIYHIYNRGAGRQSIFRQEDNYVFLLHLLKEILPGLQLTLLAYCLLPNHYHWLVRQDGETAASALPQQVFNRYVKSFNKAYNRSGTLFEDRFKAIPITADDYLHHICRYIHGNPVRHGLALAPASWPYSNYLEWIGKRAGSLVDHQFVRDHFGSPAHYAASVHAYLTGQVHLPAGLQAYLSQMEA
jgi:REP element-mobilizing transposase RayT